MKMCIICLFYRFCFSNVFTWQTLNALFIVRNMCKYFVENLSEEVVLQQFESNCDADTTTGFKSCSSPVYFRTSMFYLFFSDKKGETSCSMVDQLMNSLIEILVDVPIM